VPAVLLGQGIRCTGAYIQLQQTLHAQCETSVDEELPWRRCARVGPDGRPGLPAERLLSIAHVVAATPHVELDALVEVPHAGSDPAPDTGEDVVRHRVRRDQGVHADQSKTWKLK
jgi:hypothetical protein